MRNNFGEGNDFEEKFNARNVSLKEISSFSYERPHPRLLVFEKIMKMIKNAKKQTGFILANQRKIPRG